MTGHPVKRTSPVEIFPLVLSLWLTCGAASAAAGAPRQVPQELPTAGIPAARAAHVRGSDPEARRLLQAGAARSVTFRGLLEALEPSDVIVYVNTGVLDGPGQLVFAAAGSGCRFLRISIRVPGRDADLIAWLAHELQHAVEIATAREVRDSNGLLRLYGRIGLTDRSRVESTLAQRIWARVRDEVLFGPRTPH